MKRNPSQWIYDNLEACCDRYYSGYEKPMCMNGQGSGLWVVDWVGERRALDCAESTGGLCAGTVGGSVIKYSDPFSCCKTELPWVSPAFCEVSTLICCTARFTPWLSNPLSILQYLSLIPSAQTRTAMMGPRNITAITKPV